MAIDSKKKRKAAQGLPFTPTPPVPDGVVGAGDRAALAGVYGVGLFSDLKWRRYTRTLRRS